MRVESPFSEKSSARAILTCARGLGFLTFNKIEKKAINCICCQFVLCLFLFVTKPFFFPLRFLLLARFLWGVFECFLVMIYVDIFDSDGGVCRIHPLTPQGRSVEYIQLKHENTRLKIRRLLRPFLSYILIKVEEMYI